MGQTKLPSHVRRLLAPHKAKLPKRRKPDTARSALMRAAGVDSELELILANRLERAGLPLGETQYRFVEGRQYRFDRVWLYDVHGQPIKLACEVNGGTWTTTGAHSR